MDTNELSRPASWGETLLALGPFLLLTALFILIFILPFFLSDQSGSAFGLAVQLAVAGLVLIALFAGWVKSFPRWVFPYWGFALIITLYLSGFNGTISGYPFRGDWQAWLPLGSVALLGTVWKRSLSPVYALFKSVWKDWTLLSFLFYGALPLLFFFAYDEVQNEGLMRFIFILILGIGAIFYMRAESTWHRFASLVGGFSIGWLALMVHLSLYWNGRQLFWMTEPGSWVETLNWTSQMGAILMLILVAPVLVEFLRRAATSIRKPKAA
jgi:hypothetical protein